MKHRIVATSIIKKENFILLGQKHPWKWPYSYTWHFPGWWIDFEIESTDEAMKREIKEEVWINVKNLQKIAWDTDIEPDKNLIETYYLFLQYLCEYESGTLNPWDDLNHVEWVEINNLLKYNLNKHSLKFIKKLKLI